MLLVYCCSCLLALLTFLVLSWIRLDIRYLRLTVDETLLECFSVGNCIIIINLFSFYVTILWHISMVIILIVLLKLLLLLGCEVVVLDGSLIALLLLLILVAHAGSNINDVIIILAKHGFKAILSVMLWMLRFTMLMLNFLVLNYSHIRGSPTQLSDLILLQSLVGLGMSHWWLLSSDLTLPRLGIARSFGCLAAILVLFGGLRSILHILKLGSIFV